MKLSAISHAPMLMQYWQRHFFCFGKQRTGAAGLLCEPESNRCVLSAMQSWKHESLFAEYVAEEDLLATSFRAPRRRSSVSAHERASILQNVLYSLQRLQSALVGHEQELSWAYQLHAYVQQLQGIDPAQTPEDQFNCLYQLRKWLFWVPVLLLQSQSSQGPALLTVAHLYSTALALEPLFPELGSSFCSAMALQPLEAIISVTDAMQSQHGINTSTTEIGMLMQYPQQIAMNYRNRAIHLQQPLYQQQPNMSALGPEALSYTTIGNISPAFAPATPSYPMTQSSSSSSTPYLEVPGSQSTFSLGTQSWGAMPSPAFPPTMYTTQEEQLYGGYGSIGGFRGGTPSTEAASDTSYYQI
ncbi:hypothetical protein KC343_g9846 [Hortaea werneckii]|nr:hypothetical protein KC338_g4158 [Hortaea werneckii]KAI6868512.1 hypothetical protein KC323_g3068 [Hortaea werneckii]KAI7353214.1 hypothetical protein KC320_g4076 [Hortaea werneckii]KAI7538544.1 hypothetical protein KC317_g17755 [Hortaea werneckii]KAI7582196.1 hypothetical protein KC346_g18475 [Hortaea werneckii]